MQATGVTNRGAVVVTGASSGIGEACALHLDRLGFHVFATVRPGKDVETLRQMASERLTMVELDVTDATTIASAASIVVASVAKIGLAGLVNNAGESVGGPLEFLPIAALRRQFEVNVIGQIAVTQAFLPLLRHGHGRIVMMGSVAGSIVYPFISPYAASKAALAALTAALRVELQPWNIPVSLVVPGTIATPIWGKSVRGLDETIRALPLEGQNQYGRALAATRRYRERMNKVGSPPEVVAAAVEHALTAKKPKTRYIVGRHARLTAFLSYIPDRTIDRVMARAIRLPEHTP